MTEPLPVYAVQVIEPSAVVVECPNCHAQIGRIVWRKGERWLAAGNLLVPYLPGSTLCAGCEQPFHFGEPHRQRARRPVEVWDGKKFVEVEEENGRNKRD